MRARHLQICQKFHFPFYVWSYSGSYCPKVNLGRITSRFVKTFCNLHFSVIEITKAIIRLNHGISVSLLSKLSTRVWVTRLELNMSVLRYKVGNNIYQTQQRLRHTPCSWSACRTQKRPPLITACLLWMYILKETCGIKETITASKDSQGRCKPNPRDAPAAVSNWVTICLFPILGSS